MPRFGPISRKDLIRAFRFLGFEGPFARGSHEHMRKGEVTIFIPNPHGRDISGDLLAKLLRHAGISRAEWESTP